jgi:hypothetical protein
MVKYADNCEERLKSPDNSSDQVSSGNSGNTETGQPFIPQQVRTYSIQLICYVKNLKHLIPI